MKVIKEGKWKETWSGEYTCKEPHCGAVLAVEEEDVIPTDYCLGKYHMVCPICGEKVYINAEDLPLRLKRKIDPKRAYSTGGWD